MQGTLASLENDVVPLGAICSVADLLQRTHPVLNMIGGRQLAILHRKYINRHRVKALAGRLRSEQLTSGCSGRFTTHDDLITERENILYRPAQVWDSRAYHSKYIGKLI